MKKLLKHPLTYIFLFSLILHWHDIGTSFMDNPDDARDYQRAVQAANGTHFPISGMEMNYLDKFIRIPGGFAYLFMSIPHHFSDNPLASVIFLGLLASLTVLLIYFMAKDMGLSTPSALLASILMATNFHVNVLSREIFSPNYVLLFGTLFFWVLYRTLRDTNDPFQIFLLPLLAIAVQFDLAHMALGFTVIICFCYFQKRPRLHYFLLGALISVGLYFPYIQYLVKTYFRDITDIFSNINSEFFFYHPLKAIDAVLRPVAFALPIRIPSDECIYLNKMPYWNLNILSSALLILAALFGFIMLVYPLLKLKEKGEKNTRKFSNPILFFAISILSVITVNLIRMADCAPRYVFPLIPIIILMQALGFEYLMDRHGTGNKKTVLIVFLSAFLIVSLSEFSRALAQIRDNPFGTSIRQQLKAVDYMQSTSNHDYQIISSMEPDNLCALYMIAKYYYKVLPKHRHGGAIFEYNSTKLPLPDKDTAKFFYYRKNLLNAVPKQIEAQSMSVKKFGTISIFRIK